MQHKKTILVIRRKYARIRKELNERSARLWAAAEAMELGWGGVSAVAKATDMARDRIQRGVKELQGPKKKRGSPGDENYRVRSVGGGRKAATEKDLQLMASILALVEPDARGDPESPLRWTIKSTRELARELKRQKHIVSHSTIANLLYEAEFSLQGNRKTTEGKGHPDRDAQFNFINEQAKDFIKRRQPLISVDTKKKELVGDFKNGGREFRRKGQPEKVRVHDFVDSQLGKAIPYGVYDIANNQGWVSVGIDHDTAYFAVNSILCWWREMGRERFPKATELMITADGGGSNSSRGRLWKVALQSLADDLKLTLHVRHFPPGTSKWNKIEHRLFSFITQNWRGKPLYTRQTIVELIGATKTSKGLFVRAALDKNTYETGIKVTDEELSRVKITPHEFHGEWNYTISPKTFVSKI